MDAITNPGIDDDPNEFIGPMDILKFLWAIGAAPLDLLLYRCFSAYVVT